MFRCWPEALAAVHNEWVIKAWPGLTSGRHGDGAPAGRKSALPRCGRGVPALSVWPWRWSVSSEMETQRRHYLPSGLFSSPTQNETIRNRHRKSKAETCGVWAPTGWFTFPPSASKKADKTSMTATEANWPQGFSRVFISYLQVTVRISRIKMNRNRSVYLRDVMKLPVVHKRWRCPALGLFSKKVKSETPTTAKKKWKDAAHSRSHQKN